MKNLLSIQKDSATSHKLLMLIEQQRKRNKYVLWFVYGLMALACLGILYSLFGWMIPSFSSGDSSTAATIAAPISPTDISPKQPVDGNLGVAD